MRARLLVFKYQNFWGQKMNPRHCRNWYCVPKSRSMYDIRRFVRTGSGAVCNIWDFLPVYSYALVDLYLCSTVTCCRPALENKKLKKSLRYGYNKNSYRPILWKIVIQNSTGPWASFMLLLFFCKFKQVTMGALRHGLCRRPWQSSARSSAIILLATSWATPGALG